MNSIINKYGNSTFIYVTIKCYDGMISKCCKLKSECPRDYNFTRYLS